MIKIVFAVLIVSVVGVMIFLAGKLGEMPSATVRRTGKHLDCWKARN